MKSIVRQYAKSRIVRRPTRRFFQLYGIAYTAFSAKFTS